MSDRDRFIPYGQAYDNTVSFFDRDDGYSRTMFFRQNFLFGCRHYRRFWVRFSWLLRLCRTVQWDKILCVTGIKTNYYRPQVKM